MNHIHLVINFIYMLLYHSALIQLETMRLTNNRKLIIKCLTELNSDCGGSPPYSASSIHYMLTESYEWYGASKPVSISQINRTLRDLHDAGLVVFEYRIDPPLYKCLPQRVKYWQMADAVERNKLINEVVDVCTRASKVHGETMFDAVIYNPVSQDEKEAVIKDLKGLMQRTHPDKVDGFSDQFKQLKEWLDFVRSNVDLTKGHVKQITS